LSWGEPRRTADITAISSDPISAQDGVLPFAKTVNGRRLTSVERIESAAAAGLVTLVDTGSVFIARLDPDACD
jgi:hypothetical protein